MKKNVNPIIEGLSIPRSPGIYLFRGSRKSVLYIGKAKNLKKRVGSYFIKSNAKYAPLLKKTKKIEWIKTKSEIEALILEARLIKKHQPAFNVKLRDDKNYFYVEITGEQFPRIFLTHQSEKTKNYKLKTINCYIGPFTDGTALKHVLRYLRKSFPYCTCKKSHGGYCLNYHIKRCLGFCCSKGLDHRITKKQANEYKRNINELRQILTGRKESILKKTKRQMDQESKKQNFEKAAELRDKTFALKKVFEHSELGLSYNSPRNAHKNKKARQKSPYRQTNTNLPAERWLIKAKNIKRIEAYDASNIRGVFAAGSMVALRYSHKDRKFKPDKNFYRRFKIKTVKSANDVAMIKEILLRRLKHKEWPLPDLIIIDGGKAQLNSAVRAFRETNNLSLITYHLLLVIAIAKRKEVIYTEGHAAPFPASHLPATLKNTILAARDEAHRLAIKYHKELRSKNAFRC